MPEEEIFRPRRPNQSNEGIEMNDPNVPLDNAMNAIKMAESIKNAALGNNVESTPTQSPQHGGSMPMGNFPVQGKIPKEFLQAMQSGNAPVEQQSSGNVPKRGLNNFKSSEEAPPTPIRLRNESMGESNKLREILEGLKGKSIVYDEIELPSRGKFYDGINGPMNGIISIRPMTGEEEEILATQQFVKKGQAIDKIFGKCMKENYRTENFLSIDRTYMLIYLRGISYSSQYEVEMKCPECDRKFAKGIDLNLNVEQCPDNFNTDLRDILPKSKLPFSYRFAIGRDDQEVSNHRERNLKLNGADTTDDTLLYRTAQLVNEIDGVASKGEIKIILQNLPIDDVSYIRSCTNEPPFGVDTNIEIICPGCLHEFHVELPLEANFFFPRRKKAKTQA